MSKASRPRKEFRFWLYHDQPEEHRLMEYVDYLQKTHQFPKAVRNGLRLLWTLGEGNLAVLFELFPNLRSQFMPKPDELIEQFRQMLQARVVAAVSEPELPAGPQQLELPLGLMPREVSPPPAPLHNESMERTIQDAVQAGIQQALSQLTRMQSFAGHPPATDYPFQKRGDAPTNGKSKLLVKTHEIKMPNFDDEEDTVVIQQDSEAGESTTSNFLDAAFGFQQRKDG